MSSRALLTITIAVSVAACGIGPQLSPRALGCYAVAIDSFPDVYRRMLRIPPPAMVRLDTIYGGQIEVPASWGAQTGPTGASLRLMRPDFRIEGARVQLQRVSPSALPPDSLVLYIGGMVASLGQNDAGDWTGFAFALTSATPYGEPLVPMRLQRTDCGTERFTRMW
jgi:hypothetical protein